MNSHPPTPQGPPLSLPEKLAQAQADLAKWSRVAAHPNLSPEAAAWAKDAARSCAAVVSLYQKALDWEAAGRPPPKSKPPDSETGSETGYGLLVRFLHR